MTLIFMVCGALFTNELVPANRWYHLFTYWIEWPIILGKYVKEKLYD